MIKITSGISDFLLIAVAQGTVIGTDYENVLIPAIKAKLKAHRKICLLLQLDKGFSEFVTEAIWADAKLGLGHRKALEAVAVVTDENWIIAAAKSFRYFLGYPVKAFKKDKLAEAKEWVARKNPASRDERLHRIVFGWYGERDTQTTNSSIPSAGLPALGITSQIQSILSE